MRLKNFFPSLFMVFLAAALFAAEPEADSQTTPPDKSAVDNATAITIPAVPDEPVIPKRELKFDVSEEEVPLPLENMKEGMLDQRYVATFRLVVPKKEKLSEDLTTSLRGVRLPMGTDGVIGFAGRGVPSFDRLLSSGPGRRMTGSFTFSESGEHAYQDMLIGSPDSYRGMHQIPKGFFFSQRPADKNQPSKEVVSASEKLNSIFTENIFSRPGGLPHF